MSDRKSNRFMEKSLSTADLGRAGAWLESEIAKEERLKYFRAGIKEGYRLAMRDIRDQLEEMDDDRATKYGNTFTEILVREPSVEGRDK